MMEREREIQKRKGLMKSCIQTCVAYFSSALCCSLYLCLSLLFSLCLCCVCICSLFLYLPFFSLPSVLFFFLLAEGSLFIEKFKKLLPPFFVPQLTGQWAIFMDHYLFLRAHAIPHSSAFWFVLFLEFSFHSYQAVHVIFSFFGLIEFLFLPWPPFQPLSPFFFG